MNTDPVRILPKLPKRIPVTHPTLSGGGNDRYVLGYASTPRGALRILHKAPVPKTFVKARVRLLTIKGKPYPVWEPAPSSPLTRRS